MFHGDGELEAAAGGDRVKANREYELIVRRGGRGPRALADPERVDQVEIVEIATGEVVAASGTRRRPRRAAWRAR